MMSHSSPSTHFRPIALLAVFALAAWPFPARADWSDEFRSDFDQLGLDMAVENALGAGVNPHDILALVQQEDSIPWSTKDTMKALICSEVPRDVVRDAANRLGIPMEEFSMAYEEAVVECGSNIPDINSDGLPDAWQRQFFASIDAPQAAPGADPDGDGHNNRFEYAAGLDPVNPLSVFNQKIEAVPGQYGFVRLVFHPRLDGSTYTVLTSGTPGSADWHPLAGGTVSDSGNVRTVTFATGPGAAFFRIRITLP